MIIPISFKRFCTIVLLFMFASCGGGGGNSKDDDNGTTTSPNISLSESSYDFGGVVLDNTSDRTFTVTNNGSASLVIGAASMSGSAFSIFNDTCSNETISVNGTCSLTARFSPTAQVDNQQGTLSVPSNDPDNATATIGLSGEGYGLNVWINGIQTDSCNVTVDVTVTNPRSPDPLTALTGGNFTLYENGSQVPSISVGPNTSSSISVVLAIDWSASELGILDTIREAANSFIDNLASSDEAAGCKFNSLINFNPDTGFYTGDYSDLTAYINQDYQASGGTALYDAIYDSITRAAQGSNENKVVIVLSDGRDIGAGDVGVGSVKTLADVITHASTEKIPVFTIYYLDPTYKPDFEGEGYGKPVIMQQIADGSGGKYFDGTSDLTEVYQQITNLLSSKYEIAYTSANCDGTVDLDVRSNYTGLYGQDSGTITFAP
jgi:VWFA-related protein